MTRHTARHEHRSSSLIATVIGILAIVGSTASVGAKPPMRYHLTRIEVPQDLGTIYARDITNSGAVLGWSDSALFGVVFGRQEPKVFTIPGATFIYPQGISAGGTIIGNYDAEGGSIPFRRSPNGTVTSVVVRGTWYTVAPLDITDSGAIIGIVCASAEGPCPGFVQSASGTRIVQIPGARSTYLTGMNNAGIIVGTWDDGAGSFGAFAIERHGTVTPLDIAGASSFVPSDINDAGAIAGSYIDDDLGNRHGVVMRDGVFATVDYPAPATIDYQDPGSGLVSELPLVAVDTEVLGINARGSITGNAFAYYSDGTFSTVQTVSFTGTPVR